MKQATFQVRYDDIGDVLYISAGKVALSESEEDEDGLYLRYDSKTQKPIGATVIDYKHYWADKHAHLVKRLAEFFVMPIPQAEEAIRSVV